MLLISIVASDCRVFVIIHNIFCRTHAVAVQLFALYSRRTPHGGYFISTMLQGCSLNLISAAANV